MSKTNKQIEAMVQGAEWSAAFVSACVQIMNQREDGLQDLHHLSTPAGRLILEQVLDMAIGTKCLDISAPSALALDYLNRVRLALRHNRVVAIEAPDLKYFWADLTSQRKMFAALGSNPWQECVAVATYSRVGGLSSMLDRLHLRFARPTQFLAYAMTRTAEMDDITLATMIGDQIFSVSFDEVANEVIIKEESRNNLDSTFNWVLELR